MPRQFSINSQKVAGVINLVTLLHVAGSLDATNRDELDTWLARTYPGWPDEFRGVMARRISASVQNHAKDQAHAHA